MMALERCYGCSDTHCYRMSDRAERAPVAVRGAVVGAIIGGLFGGLPGALMGSAMGSIAHALLADPIDKAWLRVGGK